MKKNYIFTFLFLVITTFLGNAQLLTEDFSAGVPANGWTIDAQDTNWSQNPTNIAGGGVPEAKMHWSPRFNGTTRLISPSMDLTGINNVMISFKHSIDHYDGAYTVGVATRSNGGSWTSVWSMSGTNIVEQKLVLVNNSDTNNADFQFCFYFTGDSYNINNWYIDDVTVITAQTKDLSVMSINNYPFYGIGSVPITCTVGNMGLDPITSFDITYTIDGANPVTENVNGVNISSTDTYDFSFNTPWNATAGEHQIEVAISNVNANGNDDYSNNDSLNKNISIATQTTTNFPLYEEFTSSTCGPCAVFNRDAMGPFMAAHPNEIAVIKYQMDWPGSGDPYFTDEGATRRFYYGVNGVPWLVIGGTEYDITTAALNAGYAAETGKQSFFEIQADFSINGSNIIINENIIPYVSGSFKVHTVVIEKETTGNVGSNGETHFENVMMKMLPDASGQTVNFVSNQQYTNTFTFDMSSTHVEELSDLAVVIFIQFNDTKEVMQSLYLETPTSVSTDETVFDNISIYPNPSTGFLNIKTDKEINVSVTNIMGKTIISNRQVLNNHTLDLSSFANGVYLLKINDANKTGVKKIILSK